MTCARGPPMYARRDPSGESAIRPHEADAASASAESSTRLYRTTCFAGAGWSQPHTVVASSTAVSTEPATNTRSDTPRRPAIAYAAIPALLAFVYVGFPSASANAFALSKRSAGSFSSDFATAAAMFWGTDFRWTVTASA